MHLYRPASTLGLLLLASTAFANDGGAADRLAACAALNVDSERLACYDKAAGRAPALSAKASVATPASSIASTPTRAGETPEANPASIPQLGGDIANLASTETSPSDKRSLSARWELDAGDKRGAFNLRPYRLNYLLPARWTSSPNIQPYSPTPNNAVTQPLDLRHAEAKFQISFKTKLTEGLFGPHGDLWAGYTQQSNWQLYSSSSPFRDTIYEPEIMSVFRSNLHLGGGLRLRMLSLGLNHQSNGRGLPQSRSWNRIMGTAGFEYGNFQLTARAWHILRGGNLLSDNPDIGHYLGHGDLQARWYAGEHALSLTARGPLLRKHGGGALIADWNFPIHRNFKGYVQVFSGYGETLLDYNHRQNTIGIGVSLVDWL